MGFLKALYDNKSVLCVNRIKDFVGTYTSQQAGKLFCCIDDIEKWTKAESGQLKSRISEDTFQYRAMYQDPVTMRCYLDLVCTSNSRNPVFIGADDQETIARLQILEALLVQLGCAKSIGLVEDHAMQIHISQSSKPCTHHLDILKLPTKLCPERCGLGLINLRLLFRVDNNKLRPSVVSSYKNGITAV